MSLDDALDDEPPESVIATVFVSDPSVEAERVAQTLRTDGYTVVDVPLSMLVARVAVQRPRIILVDADADGALEAATAIRELPEAEGIDILYLGNAGAALADIDDAVTHHGTGFFPRPVDAPAVVRLIETLTGGAVKAFARRNTTPPPSIPSSVHPPGANALPPASMRNGSSRPPPSRRTPAIPAMSLRPVAVPNEAALLVAQTRAARHLGAPLSAELESLLLDAEERMGAQLSPESNAPTPDEEIEAVLPAEILASLDEPLEDDDMEEMLNESMAMPRPTTGGGTSTGGRPVTTGAGRTPGRRSPSYAPFPAADAAALTPPPAKTHGGLGFSTTTGSHAFRAAFPTPIPPPPVPAPSAPPATGSSPENIARLLGGASRTLEDLITPDPPRVVEVRESSEMRDARETRETYAMQPSVLAEGDAPRALGDAIAGRVTGALCFTMGTLVRRVVVRDGDIVTAASSSEDETLLAFLGARGDLPRETLRRLAGKVPAQGRHAGAALVAHGYLRQDHLLDVLRAHAEWVLGHVLQMPSGTAHHELDAPGRLRVEPGVFNAATGAAVFLEVARRSVAGADAVARLGGGSSRIGDGARTELLSECGLGGEELELVAKSRGRSVDDIAGANPGTDIVTVLYALAQLGVVESIRSLRMAPGDATGDDIAISEAAVDALDEEAIRARVGARIQLVDEADYFAILGVPADATGYEIKRAFLELRRAFEPARLLTPLVADLESDVRKIVSVLDEAYEILRDSARRERYRRAIGA